MTSRDCMDLQAGMRIWIRRPKAKDGTGAKVATVVRVDAAGTKVAVHVHRTDAEGLYMGEVGRSVRWFGCDDVLHRLSDDCCGPTAWRHQISFGAPP